ncbi:hypothetical protein [Hymenobacter sp. BRD67]|uniref:hypothetical protein n=1 Tax=Hymenobacter sp. BRD67 TaxID=2675877 RepID=UPI001563D4D9|nr:hypothetical protein [Hymenobacter sp. BRD67]QKG53845.1 hypothetical protein GKZ67_16120 [Hymenobacter sp. BRD67]
MQLVSALDLSYHREQISDLIYGLNPDYLLGLQQRQYLEASLITTHNQRNTFAYPLTGQFLQGALTFRQFVGAERSPSYATLRLHYSRYLSLGHGLYYAIGVGAQTRLFAPELAYADARGLGYTVLVRGYDYYVAEGRYSGLVQQGLSLRAWAPPRSVSRLLAILRLIPSRWLCISMLLPMPGSLAAACTGPSRCPISFPTSCWRRWAWAYIL